MRRISFFIVIFVLVAGVCRAQIEPLQIKPFEPKTIDDKVGAAAVIILGTAKSVGPADKSAKRQNSMRVQYMATVSVEKVFKGNAAMKQATVMFLHSNSRTTPALVELSEGERAVMFLVPSQTGSGFDFITPFAGKESPGRDLVDKLDSVSEKKGLKTTVSAELSMDAKGGYAVSFRIMNTSSSPLILNSTPSPWNDLVVTGPDGKLLSPKSMDRDRNALGTQLYLCPGCFFGYSADLSGLYRLSVSGSYTAQAVFKSPEGRSQGAWSGAIQSNAVTFEVK